MKYMLAVCLIGLTLTFVSVPRTHGQSPTLQKGVSVQMVPTTHAEPMPAADNLDAWVIAVAAEGRLYFGANPMTPEALIEWMKTHPRHRDAKLYIKADARAPFSDVEEALQAARVDLFATAVLLTAQTQPSAPGTMVPPKGLEVMLGPVPSGRVATLVQLGSSGAQPSLTVNDDEVSGSDLEGTLKEHFQKGDDKLILLKADPKLPFEQVAQVIDSCRATGAKVFLGM